VRIAGATALGQMHAAESILKLQKLFNDKRVGVVMAAVHALHDLKDNHAAYAIYYDVLTGNERAMD
jgi:hypothetical protein